MTERPASWRGIGGQRRGSPAGFQPHTLRVNAHVGESVEERRVCRWDAARARDVLADVGAERRHGAHNTWLSLETYPAHTRKKNCCSVGTRWTPPPVQHGDLARRFRRWQRFLRRLVFPAVAAAAAVVAVREGVAAADEATMALPRGNLRPTHRRNLRDAAAAAAAAGRVALGDGRRAEGGAAAGDADAVVAAAAAAAAGAAAVLVVVVTAERAVQTVKTSQWCVTSQCRRHRRRRRRGPIHSLDCARPARPSSRAPYLRSHLSRRVRYHPCPQRLPPAPHHPYPPPMAAIQRRPRQHPHRPPPHCPSQSHYPGSSSRGVPVH